MQSKLSSFGAKKPPYRLIATCMQEVQLVPAAGPPALSSSTSQISLQIQLYKERNEYVRTLK